MGRGPTATAPAAGVAGLMLLGIALSVTRFESPTPPPTGALARSPRLTLERAVSPPELAAEIGWVFPRSDALGWGELDVPARPADLAQHKAAGAVLARRLCAGCHGPEGRGDGPLATYLSRRPRDLRGPLRNRSLSRATASDVFRSLSAGAPAFGMPSYAHLSVADRWALVAWVLDGEGWASEVALPPRPRGPPDLHLGQDVYRARCQACHGAEGVGVPELALRDTQGDPCPPVAFAQGPTVFRTGARAADVARVVNLGRPETPMLAVRLPPDQLWAVSAYVEELARSGLARRVGAWDRYFDARASVSSIVSAIADSPPRRFKPRQSRRFSTAPGDAASGCLGCHQGLDPIAEGLMAQALSAVAGGDPNRECAVCHLGDPYARTRDSAHEGLIGNPGSLWVTSLGAGCAACHSSPGSLTTLMGAALPEPVGGRIMHATSALSDPSRATSGDYTYRVQRSLMAQETGKALLVTESVAFERPAPTSDFPLCDPDGAEPRVGSPAYRAWIAEALSTGYLERHARTLGVPTFQEAVALSGGNLARASIVDYARKACFRCHLWGEGQGTRTEHRSAGCSACHVLYGPNGFSLSEDPTIPPRTAGHAQSHTLVATPPDQQCNHCHTRNPLTEGTEPHSLAGLACVDCHTSIDVHGDGNIYPHMEHQVEVRCQDCHGEGGKRPWELPLGHDTPAARSEARGIYRQAGREHVLTNRGNPRSNWLREDGRVVVESFRTGARHVVPEPKPAASHPGDSGCAKDVAGHEAVSCSLCHNRKGPRCGSCHMTTIAYEPARDWLLSAQFYDPQSARQGNVHTPGKVRFRASDEAGVPFGAPDTRIDRAGRYTPREAGCQVTADYMQADGSLTRYVPRFNPGSRSYPPPVANTLPHENALRPRTCAECHPEGPGTPARLFGHVEGAKGGNAHPESGR